MFRQAEVLNPAKHAALRVLATEHYGFAAKTLTVPVLFSEMAHVAREFPLLFQKASETPVALMGAMPGVNAYVNRDGAWLARYKPVRIATYPFAMSAMPGKPDELAVVIDVAAEQIGTSLGQPLFDADGQMSAAMRDRLDALKKIAQQQIVTARMVRDIRAAGLLVERAIRIRKGDDPGHQINGLEFVDEAALNKMAHEDFAKLRDAGALPLIYAHLLSMSNLSSGIIPELYKAPSKGQREDLIDLDQFLDGR